jgi:hypothetical protein
VTVALVGRDLLFGSRIADLVARSGQSFVRVDDPAQLPEPSTLGVVLVDWSDRAAEWEDQLRAWVPAAEGEGTPRVVLFGSHNDLDAHAAARAFGHGPMWGRSRVLTDLPRLLGG